MKILFVTAYYKPAYIYGGPIRSLSNLCEGLAQLGMDITVFTTNANGPARLDVPLAKPMNVNNVTVWYFPLALNGLSFFYSPPLADSLRGRVTEFDVVVVEVLWEYALGLSGSACLRAHVPYIVALRGQLLPWALCQKRWRKQLHLALYGRRYLDRAAALHCTDITEADAVSKLGFRSPTLVVPNGVDVARFSDLPNRGSLRRQLGISSEAVVLLFLGRLHRKKRPDIAVEVLGATQSLFPRVHLLMVGPDEEKLTLRLQAQAHTYGCASRLHILGLLKEDEIAPVLADADLLLMPSEPESENFGMSAVEAMAAGLPVLVSEGVPIGRWAEKAGTGRMVSCTTEAFTKATLELISESERLKRMGSCGRELVRQRFDISVVAHQMLAQYKSIVTNGYPLQDVRENIEDI